VDFIKKGKFKFHRYEELKKSFGKKFQICVRFARID
jgi:hypothetical protein